MIALLIGLLCLITALLIVNGMRRPLPTRDDQPEVTVLICARDEEQNLLNLLASIDTQDYPEKNLKIILVDHLSTDATGTMMEEYARRSRFSTRVLHLKDEDKTLKGKVHALAEGLELVDTEYSLITDGDCVIPPTWVSSMMSHFTDDMDAIGGLVTVEKVQGIERPVEHMQRVDHWYYLGMMAGLTNSCGPSDGRYCWFDRLPQAITRITGRFHSAFLIGNNLGIRMSTYRRTGGYRVIGSTVIEDYALMNHFMHHSRGAMAMILEPEARIITAPIQRLKILWRQKRRWAAGLRIFNPLNTLIFSLIFLIRIVVPWMIFLYPWQALTALVMMAIGDWIVIRRISTRIGDKVHTWEIFLQEFYQIALNHLLLFAWLTRWPVVWKGQIYRRPR
ncbi:MAG: glycosyltransferase [bacterium]